MFCEIIPEIVKAAIMQFLQLFVLTQLAALCVATPAFHEAHSPEDLRELLKQEEIIPQIISDFSPSCALAAYYTSDREEVRYGNRISPSSTDDAPLVNFSCEDDDELQADSDYGFVIALTDPDAPSRNKPKWSQMCHWLVKVNGKSGEDNSDENTKVLMKYKQPGPPRSTGYHRYIFVLMYGNVTDLEPPSDRERWGFRKNPPHGKGRDVKGVQEWAEREGLKVVGANWFVAKHEKS